jgi:undecaprenyl-diphosphatase
MGDPAAPDQRPTVLVASRRSALAVMAVFSAVLLAFGWRYAGESSARWLDSHALTLAREWFPGSSGIARAVISLADPLPAAVLVGLLAAVCLALGRWRLAVLAVAGPLLTGLATTLLKSVVGRTKDGDLAYPSGHMGIITAIAIVATLLVVSLIQVRRTVAVAVVAGGTLLAAGGMALAMTVRDYHYVTDTVGGFCTAVVVVLGLALVLERLPGHGTAWS